jgi:multiple sugar transport system permease protein
MAILSLAALLNAPQEPVEAARVDGASAWQTFRFVTLPAIMPVLTIAMLFRMVEAFRQFGLFQVMTGGGPGIQTTVLNYYIYQNSFSFGMIGYGSALAVLLVALMAVAMGLLFVATRRR